MAAVTIQYITDELQEYNLVCWSIKNGKDLLAEQDDPDMNATQSADLLRRKVEGIRNARLTINLSGVNKASRRGAETFRVRTYNLDTTVNTPGTTIGMHTPEIEKLHHAILEKEREILNLKYALEKANDTIDQLRKELDEEPEEDDANGINGIVQTINQLAPLIPSLSQLFTRKETPTINGISETFETLKALDPQADEVITAICYFAKYDKGSYSMYKNILLSQANTLKQKNGPL